MRSRIVYSKRRLPRRPPPVRIPRRLRAAPAAPATRSVSFMVSINNRANDAAHVRVFQIIADVHIPGYNTWPGVSVLLLPQANIINQLTALLGQGAVPLMRFTGIKITASHVDTPLAVMYQTRPGQHHQVTTRTGYLTFKKYFDRDPANPTIRLLPSQIILASASFASFTLRFYYSTTIYTLN